jgi:hypothetical protein
MGLTNEVRFPAGVKLFIFSTASGLDLGSTVLNLVATGGFFSGEKRPQLESGHFHLISIFVELYLQSPLFIVT